MIPKMTICTTKIQIVSLVNNLNPNLYFYLYYTQSDAMLCEHNISILCIVMQSTSFQKYSTKKT